MKVKSLIYLFLILFVTICFAQSGWYNQNSGTSSILQDVFFVDQDYGWIAGAHIILHTTDGGTTWVEQPAPPVSIFYIDIYFIDRMNGWACGNDAQIIHTTDGGNTWIEQPNPYTFPNPILYSIYFTDSNTGWALGGDHGNYPTFTNRRVVLYTTNGGNTWDFQYSASNETPLYCANFISNTEGFAASEFGDVIHTSNGGVTWTERTPVSSYRLYGIYFSDSNTGWVSGEYLGVPHVASISKTTDGGNTWTTQSFGTDEYLTDINFVDEMTGWAVGGTIGGSGTSTILHTTDGGESWIYQISPTNNTLYGLSFSDSNNGWAVGNDGTIISYTNPVPVELTSFTATVSGSDVKLNWRTATETNNSGFEIQRKLIEWERVGFVEGNGTTSEENSYVFVDENLLAGKYKYRLKQIDYDGSFEISDIVEVEVLTPIEFSLSQNYPNPFNPSTAIEYSIPEGGNVKLEVYNSLGEKVWVFVSKHNEAGKYKINFSAGELSSGIYYYRIIADGFIAIKKMVLLK